MGLRSFIKGQLIDVIEFATDDKSILAHKFDDKGKQIMMGAKLTVRPGQKVVFVNEGQIADVFAEGLYTLSTSNMPVLTKLKSWKYGFESPFKVDIYFFSVDDKIEQPWGTPSKIAIRDAEFGMLRVGANGYYNYRITEPSIFLKKLVGTDREFTVEESRKQLNSQFTMSFTDFFAESKISLFDAYGNIKEFSELVYNDVKEKFTPFGLELISFSLREIRIPETVEKAMDSRAEIGALGGMDMYARKTMTDSMATAAVAAAENEGGGNMAGMGMQMGAGATMGVTMAGMMGNIMNGGGQAATPSPQAGAAATAAAAASVLCTKCGSGVAGGAKFCPSCGNPMAAANTAKSCISCGASIGDDVAFCPECGAKQSVEKHCAKCGTKVEAGVKFCPNCGNPQ